VSKPPTTADLRWTGGLTFETTLKQSAMILDSRGVDGPSPVDALAAALAGCMSVDVTDILLKGRQPLQGLRSHLMAERAQDNPHRFVRVSLHFIVAGPVSAGAIDRAIALSRDKYCSVWHSMRQDIEFGVTWEAEREIADCGMRNAD
jgi:putative redox protein